MLTRALIIAGLLAAALVALALALVSGARPSTEADATGQPLVPRQVWEATSLDITPPLGRSPALSLRRTPDGAWVFSDDGWPANEPAVRATLRLLSEVRIEGRGASVRDGTRVAIRFGDHESVLTLERGEAAFGGRALLANERGAYGSASVELAQALGDIRPDAWRSPVAMPRVEVEASRITLAYADDEAISLARTAGRWRVREPLRSRADERRIGALLGAMIDLRVQRFASPEDVAAARAQPAHSTALRAVVVETDRRTLRADDGGVATTTDATALRVIGTLDDSGESVLCEVDGVPVLVRGASLDRLVVALAELLAQSSTGASPADIGMIALRDERGREGAFRREVMSWVALGSEAERLLNPADDPGAIDLVLQFLANAQPSSVSLAQSDAPPNEASVRLYGLADDDRAALGLRWEPSERGRVLVVRDERVERRYAESQTPRLLRAWLDAE